MSNTSLSAVDKAVRSALADTQTAIESRHEMIASKVESLKDSIDRLEEEREELASHLMSALKMTGAEWQSLMDRHGSTDVARALEEKGLVRITQTNEVSTQFELTPVGQALLDEKTRGEKPRTGVEVAYEDMFGTPALAD